MAQKTISQKTEPKKAPNTRYMRDKMREKVRGMFKFDEAPGQTLSFVYRAFKEDPIERYDLVDGQVYTLPLGVAKHINKNLAYPVHTYMKNEDGSTSSRVGHKIRRATFQSLEFVDIDDIEPDADIYTVENVLI